MKYCSHSNPFQDFSYIIFKKDLFQNLRFSSQKFNIFVCDLMKKDKSSHPWIIKLESRQAWDLPFYT